MIQADSVHSTPPTNTSATTPQSSRRGFLVQAAGVVAGGAALGAGLPLPASPAATGLSSDAEADPIFAAIKAHLKAVAAHGEAVDPEMALEVSLPEDQRQSRITAWEEKIVETDDPRWPVALRARMEASNSMDNLAIDLLNIEPTTVAGIEALLRYFVDQEEGLFPEEASNDDGSDEAFGTCLVRHAADALGKIARPDCRTSILPKTAMQDRDDGGEDA
jgi:hypothetical protein